MPFSPRPSPSPRPHAVISGHSGCSIHLPARYIDYLPTGDGLQHVPLPPSLSSHQPLPDLEPVVDHPLPLVIYQTSPSDMDLFQVYPMQPSFIPKGDGSIHVVVDVPTLEAAHHAEMPDQITLESQITPETLYSAFGSPMAGLLMCWQYSRTNEKSGAELNWLWSFVTDLKFKPSVQSMFNHKCEKKCIEKYLHDQSNPFNADYGWKKLSVSILLPHEGLS